MIIAIIAAMEKNGGIGKNNDLPWKLPSDLKRFKELTTGHPVIMGRKTYESIGRPLVDRENIIITRDNSFRPSGCTIYGDIVSPLYDLWQRDVPKVFIIGGADIYKQYLPFTHVFYMTFIDASIKCDTYFPEMDLNKCELVHEEFVPADDKNEYDSVFSIYAR